MPILQQPTDRVVADTAGEVFDDETIGVALVQLETVVVNIRLGVVQLVHEGTFGSFRHLRLFVQQRKDTKRFAQKAPSGVTPGVP